MTFDEVVESTIKNQWSIQLSELEVDADFGLAQQASGAFDLQLDSDITTLKQIDLQSPLGIVKSDFIGNLTQTNVRLQKLARVGTIYTLNYSNTHTFNPFLINLVPPRSDNTVITFSINQPLLRNLFYSPATTLEQTQYLNAQASIYQNVQNTAQAIAQSLSAYWGVVGAKNILETQVELEEKLEMFARYAKRLVEEDQAGRASLHQPLANLSNTIVNRLEAEQGVVVAYNNLLFAMGRIPPTEGIEVFKEVEFENFPSLENLRELSIGCFREYLAKIPFQRMDIQADYLFEDVAALNLRSALNALMPSLNVVGSAGFVNTNSGRHGSQLYESFPNRGRIEKDYTIGLVFSYPLGNNFAKGLVKQERALLQQAQVNTSLLKAEITTSYKNAFTLNNALVRELEKARFATKEFKAAAEVEFIKLQEGLSSYFDVLGLANNAAAAKIQEINIETLYLQNLIQLHLLVGDLVIWNENKNNLEIANFRTFNCESCKINGR